MKINKNKIQYYRENPSVFLEEIYNIKLLPFQKYYLNKIWKEDKIYVPFSHSYSNKFNFNYFNSIDKKRFKKENYNRMNANPWRYKEDNKIKAQKQIKYMDKNFTNETAATVADTNIYTGPLNKNDWTENGFNPVPYSQLLDMGTVDAIFHVREVLGKDNEEVRVAALNFASYRNPGGKFIDGSNAQEECLCHESNLYNILRNFTSYYKENNSKPNKNLYTDRALYSPNVIFNKGDHIVKADIITCASPNWTAARKWNVSQVENTLVLAQRIQFIKDIAELEAVDVLILGAWGCGVFGQNPRTVARLFDFIFRESEIKNIVYAVPGGLNSDNFKAFDEYIRKS